MKLKGKNLVGSAGLELALAFGYENECNKFSLNREFVGKLIAELLAGSEAKYQLSIIKKETPISEVQLPKVAQLRIKMKEIVLNGPVLENQYLFNRNMPIEQVIAVTGGSHSTGVIGKYGDGHSMGYSIVWSGDPVELNKDQTVKLSPYDLIEYFLRDNTLSFFIVDKISYE